MQDGEESDDTPLSNVRSTTSMTKPASKKPKPSGSASTRLVRSDVESDDDDVPLIQKQQDKGKGKTKQAAGQKRKSSAISKDTKEWPSTVSHYLSNSL